MVPATSAGPWLAGGGSTVRGISDDPKDSDVIGPFVCVKHEGKDGTYAIMADGKVRFIPKDIPGAAVPGDVYHQRRRAHRQPRIDRAEIPPPAETVAVKKEPPVVKPEPPPVDPKAKLVPPVGEIPK